jgi:hypothetical protein
VRATTGVERLAQHRDTYRDAAGALRLVRDLGGYEAIGDAAYGPRVPVLAAQVGDVALVEIEGREGFAVVCGGHVMGPGAAGLVARPLREARVVWRCARG